MMTFAGGRSQADYMARVRGIPAEQCLVVPIDVGNRGVQDTFIVCCDGLKGLPDSIRATWPLADVQLCVVHLVRSSLRYTSKKHWGQVCREMREIYWRRSRGTPRR
jgi:putative transposase